MNNAINMQVLPSTRNKLRRATKTLTKANSITTLHNPQPLACTNKHSTLPQHQLDNLDWHIHHIVIILFYVLYYKN